MDTLILALIIILAIAIVLWILRARRKLGRRKSACKAMLPSSEIAQKLTQLLGEKKMLSNLLIPKQDDGTAQVGLLMIDVTGLYLFTFMGCGGRIYGDDTNKMWNRAVRGGRREMFFNPVWQNRAGLYALEKLLNETRGNCFYSYIVFDKGAELYVTLSTQDVAVTSEDELPEMLAEDIAERQEALTPARMEELYNLLRPYSLEKDTGTGLKN